MEAQDGAELCFPQLLNASCWKPQRRQSDAVLLHLLFFISALTVILNLLVIISVSHFRKLHTPTNLLLLSLAVSDFFVGLVVTPFGVLRQTSCWYLGDLTCSLYNYVSCFVISASVGDMVLISADRYVAICDPLHYSSRVTVSRVKVWVYMCWLCSFLYNSLFLKDDLMQPGRYKSCHGQCLIVIESISGTFDIIFSYMLPMASIIFLYVRVFVTAVSQARAMRCHVAAVTLHHSGTVVTRRSELKAARTLGVVVAVFIICFCPLYNGSFIKDTFDGALPETLMFILMSVNPCLNPVIYALFYSWFRKAVRLIISLQILQPGSRETNVL